LQEAVKLKSAQMGQKRKTYETWPYFMQHTLFHGEKEEYKAGRQLPFAEKIVICERVKDEGNKLYAEGKWSEAVDKYEEAPTLVYYCYSTDPGWRKNNRGIDDDVIVKVDDVGETEEDRKRRDKLRMTCCLNLAACKQKLEKFDEAIIACDNAIELDPNNVKALYRRAESRVRPIKCTAYDCDLAIKDLAKANLVDPSNQIVDKLLSRLRAERKVQREKDQKTFTGMFDRGLIYQKVIEEAAVAEEAVKNGTAKTDPDLPGPGGLPKDYDTMDIQKRIDSISEEDSLEKRTADAELLRDLYMRNGKEEEAKELNEKIQVAKKAIKDRSKPVLDWSNPTPEMVEDAKKYDLDLSDPLVINELKRLEREGIGPFAEDRENAPGPANVGSSDAPSDPSLPEVDMTAPVPWMRYIILFFVMIAVWRLVDAGILRWLVSWVYRRLFRNVLGIFGVSSAADRDSDDERGSLFAAAYKNIASLFASEADDTEL